MQSLTLFQEIKREEESSVTSKIPPVLPGV